MNTVIVGCVEADYPGIDDGLGFSIQDLCQDPSQMSSLQGADRLVVVLHKGRYHLPAVQKAARAIDVDPLGVQIIEIDDERPAGPSVAHLAGSAARAAAFEGSLPEQAKPVMQSEVTRRGFFSPLKPSYMAAPSIDQQRCAASDGCKACVEACPQLAYTWSNGQINYDMDICVPCGLCVTTCPTGAISNPSATPAMIEAQVRATISASADPIGVRFVCSRGSMVASPNWEDVVVPCSSMVTATWLLACRVLGAAGATAVPCEQCGCTLGSDDRAESANKLAATVLEEAGFDTDSAAAVSLQDALQATEIEDAFGHRAAPDIIEALATATSGSIDVRDATANLGIVEIDPATCTLCGQCAKGCPTGALMESYLGDEVSITFDSRLCVNCSQCLSSCPEIERGAIAVAGGFDTASLAEKPRVLNRGDVARCEICGKAFAPTSTMARIAALLGPEFDATMSVVGKRCLDCRGR